MKIVSILILGIAALLAPICVQAETLDDANRAFAAGRFAESTISYENLISQHGYSAPVLFDLGNSYYSDGDFAQAILAYKRAQWLAPNDPDIAANLRLAEKKAGLPVSEPRLREKFSGVLSPSGWAWTACGAWTVLCVSLLLRTAVPQSRSLFALAGVASAFVLFGAIIAIMVTATELKEAVVTDKGAAALISPFPAAQTVFTPAPGTTVKVQKSYDSFFLVADATGRSGWINKSQLTPIIAAP